MDFVIFVIRYMVFVLPFFILQETHHWLAKFLKENGIYDGWDMWHSLIVSMIIVLIVFYYAGVR